MQVDFSDGQNMYRRELKIPRFFLSSTEIESVLLLGAELSPGSHGFRWSDIYIEPRRFRFRFFRPILRIDATWKNRLIDSCWKNRLIDSLEPWQESIDRFLKTTFQLVWHSTPLVTTTSYRRGKSLQQLG